MGTSYQTLLVVEELTRVRDALAASGVDGLVIPAGAGRTAVMPREDRFDYIDPARLAELVSAKPGFAAVSNEVVDSDVVLMRAFRDGRLIHEYVSDESMLVDWFIDDDGATKFRFGGVEYAADAPSPRGPRGADPTALAPFGIDPVDIGRLGVALRGDFDRGTSVFAEFQHRLILKAMNLDPRGLTTAFRWARLEDLPGAVRIQEATRPQSAATVRGFSSGLRITAVLETGLPSDVDPLAAAQVIADAVVGVHPPVRADVGYVAVIPGAAAATEILMMSMRLAPAPRRATYFVALTVEASAAMADERTLLDGAERAWTAALRTRYGLGEDQGPAVLPIAPEQFDIGFGAAQEHRSSRPVT